MREIKFRAWDKKGNRMFNAYGLGRDFVTEDTDDGVDPGVNCFDGDDFKNNIVVMQYTGLKDKNGTEIYEGDIVLTVDDMDSQYFGGKERVLHEEVEFKGGAFYPVCLMDESEFEVIGNIHQNSELL